MFNRRPKFIKGDIDSVLAACLKKDQQAETELIRMFYAYAKSIGMRYGSGPAETEEIVNDGFLKVFTNLDKYDHTQPFKGWLRTIMINTAIDHYRKNQRYHDTLDISGFEATDVADDVIERISGTEILEMVQRLPPSYRMVFTLYVIDGYNHREIAELLGIKEGTSKSNLQDARKKMQMMIKTTFPQIYLAHRVKDRVNEN